MTYWLNGEMTAAVPTLRVDDRGFTLGDGLFETLAVRDGEAVWTEAHLRRLRSGCEVLAMPLSYPNEVLHEAMAATIAANAVTQGILRLTVSRGPAPRGLLPPEVAAPTVVITVEPVPLAPPAPARLVIAEEVRRNEQSVLSRIKSLNYLEGILAALEARRRGVDDALLLNSIGRIAEATVSNLFAVIDGQVVTPPVTDGALPGIMRAAVIKVLDAAERSLQPRDLAQASEVLLTNASGIRPVLAIDGVRVGQGRPGPVWGSLGGLVLGRPQP